MGEEQHETKGLLAKLKARDAAEKAAKKAGAGKIESKPESQPESQGEAVAEAKSEVKAQEEQLSAGSPAASSLSSLLSRSMPEDEIKVKAPEPAVESPEEDDSSGSSLGDAISNALDKLLSEDGDPGSFAAKDSDTAGDAKVEPPAAQPVAALDTANRLPADKASSSLSKLLDDDPDRFDRPINSPMRQAEGTLEAAIAASAEDPSAMDTLPEEAHPLTLTNSKVDALSRLLEVASKAPQKTPDDKPKTNDSSNKLAEMISNAQNQAARQQDGMDAPEYMPPGNQPARESYTSPFGGGTSPFGSPSNINSGVGGQSSSAPANVPTTSPFGTPVNSSNSGVSLNHTPAGSFSTTGQSQQPAAAFNDTGSMADMPKASGIAAVMP